MSEWARVTNRGRRDHSEPEIVKALEAGNCAVEKAGHKGFPDLVVWVRDLEQYELVECKDGNEGLTPTQVAWWAEWRAKGGRKPVILRSGAEAVAWLKSLRSKDDLDTPASAREGA